MRIWLITFLLVIASKGASADCVFDCFSGTGENPRSELTFTTLTSSTALPLIDYVHYGVPAQAANPTNTFNGHLSLNITAGALAEQGTSLASVYIAADSLPPFSFSFVQYGTHVLPTQRQLINTGHTAWEWILLPGRVWNERGDNGYSRVALPFALQEINANCTHNGVMTFLFKDDGSVSDVAYQIAQETCRYFKFNLHGKIAASFTPALIANAQQVIDDYRREYANRLSLKPLAALASDYPNSGIDLTQIGSDQTASQLTTYGVLYNGTHYQGPCATRYGEYPFCDVMALPSYSIAKTIVAGLAVMRAEQKYPDKLQHLKVGEWVAECQGSQWQDVTLLNALDMATGNYQSAQALVDEKAQKTIDEFFVSASHADKIKHSCAYPRQSPPGSTFVYHTSDSYIVSRVLQQYQQQLRGPTADYFTDILVNELYKPLMLSPVTYSTKRTYDVQQQVWAGYGLTLLADDIAKLGQFVGQSNGKIQGQTVLDSKLLSEALQQSTNGGLQVSSNARYQHSVWAFDLKSSTQFNCSTATWIPYMSGFGGIGVVMLPNNMLYYFVSDNMQYGFVKTLMELHKIAPICE
ncbi:hypothetical protein [Aliiglaciecola litoralis]|uniref:Beta-lactamase-related domain-containing protein n=1 Tax=Aliiglaciecola litoralis TaxID=582857 RepID=A0ABN1LPF1_9ALTE